MIHVLFIFFWHVLGRKPDGQRFRVNQPPTRKRLLVVDDERIQQLLVTHAVAPMGFDVDAAADLPSASACLRAGRYDAVVLDLSLRESEGISLLRALRHR